MMTTLGHYELLGVLGDGGMGTVYEGRDPRFDRKVAIKVLHPHFARETGVADRFRTEAVIQAKLQHPHIVNVFDFIEADGVLAIVQERVVGEPLDDWLRTRGAQPVEWARRVVDQVASALTHAHGHGLVHRDIKPSNILISDVNGQPLAKVTDFGIAKVLGADKQRTATNAKMGTVAYMAPEQVTNPKGVDERADVYALGAVLYEILTGRPAFDAETEFELMERIVRVPAPKPSLATEGVPAWLDTVTAKAMAKAPDDRFATCELLRQAVVVGAAVESTPASPAAAGAPPDAAAPDVAPRFDAPMAQVSGARPAVPVSVLRHGAGVVPRAGLAAAAVIALGGFALFAYAQAADRSAWQEASAAGTVMALQSYVESRPGGDYRQEAEQRIGELQRQLDGEAWQRVDGSEPALRGYLTAFPSGAHAAAAKDALTTLEQQAMASQAQEAADAEAWRLALSDGTAEAVDRYLATHPSGRFTAEATDLRASIQRRQSEIAESDRQRRAELEAVQARAAAEEAEARRRADARAAEEAREAARLAEEARKPSYIETTLPAGVELVVQLRSDLNSQTASVEDPVEAIIAQAVTARGVVAVPPGARIVGTVAEIERGGKMNTRARLGVRFGTLHVQETRHTVRTNMLVVEGAAPRAVEKAVGGAVVGAILGGLLGGKKGAAIGAATGAGGGVAASQAADDSAATLAAGSKWTMRLERPLTVLVEVVKR